MFDMVDLVEIDDFDGYYVFAIQTHPLVDSAIISSTYLCYYDILSEFEFEQRLIPRQIVGIAEFQWMHFTTILHYLLQEVQLQMIGLQLMMEQQQIVLINKVLGQKDYYALGKISEGSYGEIFKVRHLETGQTFAMKALQLSKLQKLQKMHQVLVEISVLQHLSHPGIIRYHAKLQRPNYIGLLLEYCPFGDMFKVMKKVNVNIELANKKREIAVYYLAQILQAIDYLHSAGIVHRDIKPENIVLGPDHKVRIIDFGTAKVTNSSLLTSKQSQQIKEIREAEGITDETLVGSLNYLSPEVLKLEYSEKCDIWAYGVLAYKFIYNRLPFEGRDKIQIFRRIAQEEIEFVGSDKEFQEMLRMCLQKDPTKRSTAKQLKQCALFKEIDFTGVFDLPPPIPVLMKSRTIEISESNTNGAFLYEVELEKKMFFGNFKPRLLTVEEIGGRLLMAYRYLPSRKVRNEFELYLNDYAQLTKNGEFEVVTCDKHYFFRAREGQKADQVVERINGLIKNCYHLN